jgi:leader peptidase (prepilin peptidase) / N-methyltransferase
MLVTLVLIILGLCLGSFVNALVWRLHERSKNSKQKKLSIIHGRSMCPNCQHVLAARDLVPILSWLSLKGRCRYCKNPISIQYPLVEFVTAGLFIFSYVFWPASFSFDEKILFGFWLVFLGGLIALAVYDLRWYLLPNAIVYPLYAVILVQIIFATLNSSDPWNVITTAFWGLLIGGGIFYCLFQLSKGKWIGGGDVKLGGLLGLAIGGPSSSFLLIFIASLIGSFIALPLLLMGRAKRGSQLPFGPFLILAAVIVKLFGVSIITWYKDRLLL